MSAEAGTNANLRSIQWLRGIAALQVIVYHAVANMGKYDAHTAAGIALHVTPWGVDLFFVISGFIMVFVTKGHSGSVKDTLFFWERRILRIVPLYWLVTSVKIVAALAAPHLTDYRPTLDHAIASYFFIPWIDAYGRAMPPLYLGWTLNYEMYFYVVLGFILLLPQRLFMVILGIWAIGSIALGVVSGVSSPILKLMTGPNLLEFLLGAVIGWLWIKGRVVPARLAVPLLALGIALMLGVDLLDIHAHNAVKFGVPSALIVASALSIERHRVFDFNWRVPLMLGDASYSLYLSNPFALTAMIVLFSIDDMYAHVPPGLLAMLEIVVASLVGIMVFRLIEHPLHDWGRTVSVVRRRPRAAPAFDVETPISRSCPPATGRRPSSRASQAAPLPAETAGAASWAARTRCPAD